MLTIGYIFAGFLALFIAVERALNRHYHNRIKERDHRARCLEHAIKTTKNFEPEEIKKEAEGYWDWLNKRK